MRRGYRFQPKAKLYGADPISRRLVGWYFMRVIIDVVPRVIRWGRRVRSPGPRTGWRWTMSFETPRRVGDFATAILTFIDESGYPYSVRCRAMRDPEGGRVRVHIPSDVPVAPGPAGLLCHSHDQEFWNQQSLTARGRIRRHPGTPAPGCSARRATSRDLARAGRLVSGTTWTWKP